MVTCFTELQQLDAQTPIKIVVVLYELELRYLTTGWQFLLKCCEMLKLKNNRYIKWCWLQVEYIKLGMKWNQQIW